MVKYNLNLDDLVPAFSKFSYLEHLIELFPEIKITAFLPIANGELGRNQHILRHPGWCERVRQLPKANFEVAIHGYRHSYTVSTGPHRIRVPEFKLLTKPEAIKLLQECEQVFQEAKIEFIRGFRPPRWEMSEGTARALEELKYLFLSDSPRFYEAHQDIKIPRVFANSDINENEEYVEVKSYRHLLLNSQDYYVHRGHFISNSCENDLIPETLANIEQTISSFDEVSFKFLSEIAAEAGS